MTCPCMSQRKIPAVFQVPLARQARLEPQVHIHDHQNETLCCTGCSITRETRTCLAILIERGSLPACQTSASCSQAQAVPLELREPRERAAHQVRGQGYWRGDGWQQGIEYLRPHGGQCALSRFVQFRKGSTWYPCYPCHANPEVPSIAMCLKHLHVCRSHGRLWRIRSNRSAPVPAMKEPRQISMQPQSLPFTQFRGVSRPGDSHVHISHMGVSSFSGASGATGASGASGASGKRTHLPNLAVDMQIDIPLPPYFLTLPKCNVLTGDRCETFWHGSHPHNPSRHKPEMYTVCLQVQQAPQVQRVPRERAARQVSGYSCWA